MAAMPAQPKLSLFRPLWGLIAEDGGVLSLDAALKLIAARGYTGVECSVGLVSSLGSLAAPINFAERLASHGLLWAPMVLTCPLDGTNPFVGAHPTAGPGSPPAKHFAAWRGQMQSVLDTGIPLERIAFVNSITGHDSMAFDDAVTLFALIEGWYDAHWDRVAVPLVHETHRGRCLNTPWVTRRLLHALPGVQLAADLAHFTCVTESVGARVDSQGGKSRGGEVDDLDRDMLTEAICEIAGNCAHVHGRIGCDQSPQVVDPRVRAAAALRERFEAWWDEIWRVRALQGHTRFTFTPEAGPLPYQPDWGSLSDAERDDEATHVRLAEKLDGINEWMARRARSRFEALLAEP